MYADPRPLLLALLVACGGADGAADTDDASGTTTATTATTPTGQTTPTNPTNPTPTTSTDQASVDMTVVGGGVLTLGGATLTVTPGALAQDTTITATMAAPDPSLPDAATVEGSVYDFGPKGLMFLVPATLELPVATAPGTDQEVVISWLDEDAGAWVDLPTTYDGATATADVDHFTMFAARLVDGALVELTCPPYAACGGDPVGSWTFDAMCLDLTVPDATCPGAEGGLWIQLNSGWLDIDVGGQWSSHTDIVNHFWRESLPACHGAIADCSEIEDVALGEVCTGDPAVQCDCEILQVDVADFNGVWTASGLDLSLTDTGFNRTDYTFCVNGSAMQMVESAGIGRQYELSL